MCDSWFYGLCRNLDEVSERHGTKNCAESLDALTQELRDGGQLDGKSSYVMDEQAINLFMEVMKAAPNKFQARYCLSCAFAVLPNDPIAVLWHLSHGGINCWMRSQKRDNGIPCCWYRRRSRCMTDADFEILRRNEKQYYKERQKICKKHK